jgi:cyclopropane fatty-acyl-phospholipid synthase-like methyltransferase
MERLDPRKEIVAAGYDRLADTYLEWGRQVTADPRARMLAAFMNRLPDGARVLDIGCGAGVPSTRDLANRFGVVGVDISRVQLELARRNVPVAEFIEGDITDLEFADSTFDGIAALYAISHIPREEHAQLFTDVFRWLAAGGLFLATLGASDGPDWTGEWLGKPMFFSSHDADVNRQLLESAGFELLLDEVLETHEPGGIVSFLWVIAQKAPLS